MSLSCPDSRFIPSTRYSFSRRPPMPTLGAELPTAYETHVQCARAAARVDSGDTRTCRLCRVRISPPRLPPSEGVAHNDCYLCRFPRPAVASDYTFFCCWTNGSGRRGSPIRPPLLSRAPRRSLHHGSASPSSVPGARSRHRAANSTPRDYLLRFISLMHYQVLTLGRNTSLQLTTGSSKYNGE